MWHANQIDLPRRQGLNQASFMSSASAIPTIVAARTLLRPLRPEDALPMYDLMDNPEVMRYFPNPSRPPLVKVRRMLERQDAHWLSHAYGWWALERLEVAGLIGWCGLQSLPDTHETEVAYMLGQRFWGRGLATEAARAALWFGFQRLGLGEIVGIVHVQNVRSQRVLAKIGLGQPAPATYFDIPCLRSSIKGAEYRVRPGETYKLTVPDQTKAAKEETSSEPGAAGCGMV
jgi:RimJ/RimL family protein N-acetyltransferase